MKKSNHIMAIAELSESEGVFTTAQAERMGITRDALHDAVESGRLDRIARGAYRMVGSGSSYVDGLVAIWKLTDPAVFTHERMRFDAWDGIAVGGHTAASLLGVGGFQLPPYRLYAPKRINSRNPMASFSRRDVPREEVAFVQGLPVTKAERTIADLVRDDEDMSLVADALRDAVYKNRGFNLKKLERLLTQGQTKVMPRPAFDELLANAGVIPEGAE